MSLNEKHLKQKSKNIIKNPNTTCQLVFSTMINNGWPLTFLYFEVPFLPFSIFHSLNFAAKLLPNKKDEKG